MSINTKSTKAQILAAYNDLARELELTKRQLADVTTEKGILMSEVQILKQSYDEVESQLIAAEAQIKRQGQVIAAQPKSAPHAPKPAPKPQAPVAEIESVSPVIQITDADRDVYRKFNALSREQRLSIINWARPQFGHVGIHNIIAVRQAWHEFNNPASCADESNLADIA